MAITDHPATPECLDRDERSERGQADIAFDGFAALARQLGFDYCAYVARLPFRIAEPVLVSFSNFPPSWQDRCRRTGYASLDPILRHAAASSAPVLWHDDLFADARHYRQEARACGLNHGWSKGIHDPRGLVGLFSVVRACGAIDEAELRDKLPLLLWLAQATHQEMGSRLLADPAAWPAPARLSTQEKKILQLSADGRTGNEIAALLGISERTVNFHIGNAIAKLGVRNRIHAVARAIRLGLLD